MYTTFDHDTQADKVTCTLNMNSIDGLFKKQELSSKTTKLAGVCLCVCACVCVYISAKHFKITTQKI